MVEKGYNAGEGAYPEGVHPALDNRVGAQRPPLESDPAVPQQVDGPDLLHQAEHAEAVARAEQEADVARKGMFSPGDHGLGDLAARERGDQGYDAGQAADVLETDPGNPGSASTDLKDAGGGATMAPGSRGANVSASAKDAGDDGDVSKGGQGKTSASSSQSSSSSSASAKK